MTVEPTPSTGYSNRPYAYALVGVALLIGVAWLNQDRVQPVTTGTVAPDFEVKDLGGGLARLSDHSDVVVLVNIWATWCLPCRVEMPSMERLYQEVGEEGLEIMAVSIDADLGQFDPVGNPGGNIQAFADSLALTFPMLHDPSGRMIQRLYRTTGVPETFLIGKDGIIYKKVAGGTEWDAPEHKELIQRLLAAPQ
jgi:cytochrome c biogenesis protein CcmG/thiol:disulfide interchange protein DsbE